MASFTRPFDPAKFIRHADITITLPDPSRNAGDPIVWPAVARYAGGTLTLSEITFRPDPAAPGAVIIHRLISPVVGAARIIPLDNSLTTTITSLVEISPLPFTIASTLRALPAGVPTFYFGYQLPGIVDDKLVFPSTNPDDGSFDSDSLGRVSVLYFGALFQDRVSLSPRVWIKMIGDAMTAAGEAAADVAQWLSLADLYNDDARNAVVRVLDQVGAPLGNQPIIITPTNATAITLPTDANRRAGSLSIYQYRSATGIAALERCAAV